jgi:hypothetical protein
MCGYGCQSQRTAAFDCGKVFTFGGQRSLKSNMCSARPVVNLHNFGGFLATDYTSDMASP